jgi:hypothetical protein
LSVTRKNTEVRSKALPARISITEMIKQFGDETNRKVNATIVSLKTEKEKKKTHLVTNK